MYLQFWMSEIGLQYLWMHAWCIRQFIMSFQTIFHYYPYFSPRISNKWNVTKWTNDIGQMSWSMLVKVKKVELCNNTYSWITIVHDKFLNFAFMACFKFRLRISSSICGIVNSRNTVWYRIFRCIWLQGWFVAWFKDIDLNAATYIRGGRTIQQKQKKAEKGNAWDFEIIFTSLL